MNSGNERKKIHNLDCSGEASNFDLKLILSDENSDDVLKAHQDASSGENSAGGIQCKSTSVPFNSASG
jgi:hypothetical protein